MPRASAYPAIWEGWLVPVPLRDVVDEGQSYSYCGCSGFEENRRRKLTNKHKKFIDFHIWLKVSTQVKIRHTEAILGLNIQEYIYLDWVLFY